MRSTRGTASAGSAAARAGRAAALGGGVAGAGGGSRRGAGSAGGGLAPVSMTAGRAVWPGNGTLVQPAASPQTASTSHQRRRMPGNSGAVEDRCEPMTEHFGAGRGRLKRRGAASRGPCDFVPTSRAAVAHMQPHTGHVDPGDQHGFHASDFVKRPAAATDFKDAP